MDGARRAYDILRGYVNHGWDSLTSPEEESAQRELREAIENPVSIPTQQVNKTEDEPSLTLDQARTLFDLSSSTTSKQIAEAHERLCGTADPSKFQEGSDAWHRARLLRRRLDKARAILLENIDPTVRRFERLEID